MVLSILVVTELFPALQWKNAEDWPRLAQVFSIAGYHPEYVQRYKAAMRRRAREAAEILAGIVLIAAPDLSTSAEPTHSATVLGSSNPQLSRGAELLEAGSVEEGIRLTLEGLELPADTLDRAAGYSNLCAGYAMLKRWAEALPHCNASLELNRSNWRAFNNRASVYAAMGLFELAMDDVRAGLDLAPRSQTLLDSLRIIEHNRRVTGRHGSSPTRPL